MSLISAFPAWSSSLISQATWFALNFSILRAPGGIRTRMLWFLPRSKMKQSDLFRELAETGTLKYFLKQDAVF